jgi:cobalt/nickel transport protein
MRKVTGLALAILVAAATPAAAHFNMLLPAGNGSAKKGEAVIVLYLWGHPFEHQLFDAPHPESLIVQTPDGRRADLLATLEKSTVPAGEGKNATAYRFLFTPEARGDYVFVLKTPPIWMEEEGEFFHDTVKVVLHVQAQKGWDASAGEAFEIVPLTRPYGLQPGMVFQAQLEARPPKAGVVFPVFAPLTHPVEIERYNPEPPMSLPPDEQVTRTARPDRTGVVTGTLTESGWWCLTAARSGGTRSHDGKERPVLERTTLWVFVDEKPPK